MVIKNKVIFKDESPKQSPRVWITTRLKQEAVIALYTAGAYLPKGRMSHPAMLIIKIFLPLTDMLTDWINAGIG